MKSVFAVISLVIALCCRTADAYYVVDSNGNVVGYLFGPGVVTTTIKGQLTAFALSQNGVTGLVPTGFDFISPNCTGQKYLPAPGNPNISYTYIFSDGVNAGPDFNIYIPARALVTITPHSTSTYPQGCIFFPNPQPALEGKAKVLNVTAAPPFTLK